MRSSASTCPSPDLIVDFVQARSTLEERHLIDEHLDACAACRKLVGIAAMSPLVSVPRGGAKWVLRAFARLFGPAWGNAKVSLDAVVEEERAVLQRRLAILAGVSAALLALSLVLSFLIIGTLAPQRFVAYVCDPHQAISFGLALGLALGWRLLKNPQRRFSFAALRAIDPLGTVLLSSMLAANSTLENVGKPGALTTALSIGHVLVLRAILVPSSGTRSVAIGAAAMFGGVLVQSGLLSIHAAYGGPLDPQAPPLSVAVITLLWLTISCAASGIVSRVLAEARGEVARLRVAGQYLLHDKVGEGSTGAVYRATHFMLRRPAAIKLLVPLTASGATAADFEREVRHTARIQHPNTISIFDYGRTADGVFYYAMEYLDGCNLQRLVEEAGPLPPGRVVHLLDQILASLAATHDLGLVHRDVKPANVMAIGSSAPDRVKVLDFGLVQETEKLDDGDDRLAGTPAYIAPERLDGARATASSDIYSAAAVGYFLLTGTTVFAADTLGEMLRLQKEAEPEHPAHRLGLAVPDDLAALLMASLAKDPARRPDSAKSFRAGLHDCRVKPWTDADARAWWFEWEPKLQRQ